MSYNPLPQTNTGDSKAGDLSSLERTLNRLRQDEQARRAEAERIPAGEYYRAVPQSVYEIAPVTETEKRVMLAILQLEGKLRCRNCVRACKGRTSFNYDFSCFRAKPDLFRDAIRKTRAIINIVKSSQTKQQKL
ncbi:MAG: hypothetical protein LIO91_10410 [Bacteroidales bacterium]|nr:hypothetical protein [Bacteroidales bacterium]